MEKTVKIRDIEIRFKTSAAVPHIYRRRTGRDLFVDMAKLTSQLEKGKDENGTSVLPIESLEMFEDMAYILAKHADPDNVPESIESWLDQFETFDIFAILPQIMEMWNAETRTTSKLKKKNEKLTAK